MRSQPLETFGASKRLLLRHPSAVDFHERPNTTVVGITVTGEAVASILDELTQYVSVVLPTADVSSWTCKTWSSSAPEAFQSVHQ